MAEGYGSSVRERRGLRGATARGQEQRGRADRQCGGERGPVEGSARGGLVPKPYEEWTKDEARGADAARIGIERRSSDPRTKLIRGACSSH